MMIKNIFEIIKKINARENVFIINVLFKKGGLSGINKHYNVIKYNKTNKIK